jgi:hypothetical protein
MQTLTDGQQTEFQTEDEDAQGYQEAFSFISDRQGDAP